MVNCQKKCKIPNSKAQSNEDEKRKTQKRPDTGPGEPGMATCAHLKLKSSATGRAGDLTGPLIALAAVPHPAWACRLHTVLVGQGRPLPSCQSYRLWISKRQAADPVVISPWCGVGERGAAELYD